MRTAPLSIHSYFVMELSIAPESSGVNSYFVKKLYFWTEFYVFAVMTCVFDGTREKTEAVSKQHRFDTASQLTAW